ncbi:MAG: glucose-6-phosphate isomerase [Rikenellaceae bacterium]
MKTLSINIDNIFPFVDRSEFEALLQESVACNKTVENGTGVGNDFLGWVDLPSQISAEHIETINACGKHLGSLAEVVIVVGIGGSYLGARAVLDALGDTFSLLHKRRSAPIVLFAGQNLSEDYYTEMMNAVKGYSIATVVISKSGTTTEPAIAFRVVKAEIEARYGKAGARERIVAVTDASRGALHTLATKEGYRRFVIPDDVGGRFSVLTPVGLLPMAVAGIDVAAFVQGMADARKACCSSVPVEENPAQVYAAARNALYRKGYGTEIFASYEPKVQYIGEWWKQLFGESEGKDGKGIFPASVTLTADLHSMGQYIQEGERRLFESVVSIASPSSTLSVENDDDDLDGLNYLSGSRLSDINRMARLGTMLAHVDGGVPNIAIEIPEMTAYNVGYLLYFFERSCGISGYLLGVNPFDQPGVEAYKKNMFALLGKAGFEEAGEELRKRL